MKTRSLVISLLGTGVTLALVLSSVRPLLAQTARGAAARDPLIGVWIFDRANSSFSRGTNIDKRIVTFELQKDGSIRHTTDTTESLFRDVAIFAFPDSYQVTYTFRFDGKDYPTPGAALDTVSFRRVASDAIERTGKVMGKAVETSTWTISSDGRVLTMTTKGTDEDGMEYTSTQVFNRR